MKRVTCDSFKEWM